MANIIDLRERLLRGHGIAPAYRVVRIDRGRRTGPVQVIKAGTDEQAKVRTVALVCTHAIELWDRKRFIARFPPRHQPVVSSIRLIGDPPRPL